MITLEKLMIAVSKDCDIDTQTTQYCLKRLRAEGSQFWTKTLPEFSKFILTSL